MAKAKSVESLSFEEAMGELETIVRKLESGDAPLEAALQDFTRGNALKEHCAKKLEEARLKVEKLTINAQGEPTGAQDFAESASH